MPEQQDLGEAIEERRYPNRSFISTLRFLLVMLALFSIVTILFTQIFVGVIVDGDSMFPTLESGDYLFADTTAGIERGDIVVFESPEAGFEGTELIKRVIGLPGDEIVITEDGRVARKEAGGGSLVWLEEPYINGAWTQYRENHIVVPEGTIYVLGDNRAVSHDSRSFGAVPIENVLGVITDWSMGCKEFLTVFFGIFH